jgi:hypothetical protein
MHPWLTWNRTELRDGRLPVWNPANGAGTPQLASVSARAVNLSSRSERIPTS